MTVKGPRPVRGATWAGLALASLPAPRTDPTRAGEVAREVLSRPEFQEQAEPLTARILRWVLRQIGRLIQAILEAATGGGLKSVGFIILFIVIVGLVGFLVWRVLRRLTPDPGVDPDDQPVLRPATDWLADAEAHERRGDWRQAVRCRYRALVADLAVRGLVEEVPGTTAGEYRAQVRGNAPTVAGDFGGATELFEVAWYGDLPTGAGESAAFRRLAERVLVEAGP